MLTGRKLFCKAPCILNDSWPPKASLKNLTTNDFSYKLATTNPLVHFIKNCKLFSWVHTSLQHLIDTQLASCLSSWSSRIMCPPITCVLWMSSWSSGLLQPPLEKFPRIYSRHYGLLCPLWRYFELYPISTIFIRPLPPL